MAPLSNAERQRRYKQKAQQSGLERLDYIIPFETAIKLSYLADHWQCTRTEALSRVLIEAWRREGSPVPVVDTEGPKPKP